MKQSFLFFLLLFSTDLLASQYIKIVDVGAGLCIIGVDQKNSKYFIYDTGNWRNSECVVQTKALINSNTIDLIILSHSDSDHIGNTYEIEKSFKIKRLVHTGYERNRIKTWRKTQAAINNMLISGGIVHNIANDKKLPDTIKIGDFSIDFIYGRSNWDETKLAEAERRNAISIVVKVTLDGKSVLLPGDIIGRNTRGENRDCLHTESLLVKKNQI
ncbi:hypothetical protein TUM4438_36510 [Shewanella sairae]|uniref:Metallo-beta-lactamase domain-containing protein n=1 Tax=Shewanella sairae TaxID=190310 RepID=A0ABQ4PP80_9GAMM|nr:MBL fold metallo-hydrolase [Shewanella sairae]MCL1132104.1 MBL fold metallo-hydrolase [Shewanella sairae]GIU50453.1 hypothetical protein TUM4438_36510 [Shewanella sairae]